MPCHFFTKYNLPSNLSANEIRLYINLPDRNLTTVNRITIKLPGVDLQIVRKGSGPQVLLLHGDDGPEDRLPFFDRMAEHYQVIQPIHPRFAGTAIPEHFDNLQDLVFLYLDLIDHLGLKDAILLGFSMGGWAAAEIAVMSAQKFSKLVLVDSVGIKPGGPFDRDIADVFALPPTEQARLTWHDPSLAPDPATMTDDELQLLAAQRVALGFYTWEPYMHNPKLPHRLHRINIPTQLIWGESDGIVSLQYGQALQNMIPGANMVVISKAGHAPHAEQPEEFMKNFLNFAKS